MEPPHSVTEGPPHRCQRDLGREGSERLRCPAHAPRNAWDAGPQQISWRACATGARPPRRLIRVDRDTRTHLAPLLHRVSINSHCGKAVMRAAIATAALAWVLASSCSPAEGPLGVHVGDTVEFRRESWRVMAFGSDWVALGRPVKSDRTGIGMRSTEEILRERRNPSLHVERFLLGHGDSQISHFTDVRCPH